MNLVVAFLIGLAVMSRPARLEAAGLLVMLSRPSSES